MKTEIVAKKYGRNLVVVIDGTKRTRVIATEADKKDEEVIKDKITRFNKKNSDKLLNEIINLVDPSNKEKEIIEAKKKGIKKAIKKEVKKEAKQTKEKAKSTSELIDELSKTELTGEDSAKLEKLLNKGKQVKEVTTVPTTVTKSPRRGEW